MNLKLLTAYCLLLILLLLSATKIMAATLIDEDFESWPPVGWQIVDHNGNGAWTNHNAIHGWVNYINKDKPIGERGDVAVADSDYFDAETDTSLITPPLDLSDHSYIVLYYETVYNDAWFYDDYADVDVSTNSGADWINVLHWEGESQREYGPGTNVTVNVSAAAGCSNALIRFHYFSPGDYWWEIDNVVILADTIDPTEFEAVGAATTQIDLSWITNEVGDEVILAYFLSDAIGTPADGTVYNVGNSIPGGGTIIYKGSGTDFSHTNFILEATEYFYKIWSVNSHTQYSAGVADSAFSCVGTFPYLESYESDLGVWHGVENNEFDWKRGSGTTPSSETGPDGGANGSDYYIYTEASGIANQGKSFLIDASFDFISSPNPELAFFYHMYGVDMGSLHVDVCDDSSNWHSNLWEISGEQQTSSSDPWKNAVVEMQQFGGQSPVKVRFRGITGNDFHSDMAVDYITITNRPGGLFFTPPSQSGSGHLGTTVQYNINALNLTGGDSDFNLFYTGAGGGAGWNETGPANTGFLNYRSSTNLTVNVTIDPNAAAWEAHTSIVTSVSTDGVFTNSTVLITKCDWNYDIYFEDFNREFYWPEGWTNYFLGQEVEGWFHGIERYLLLWAPAHDPAYGATNWFVSPAIDFGVDANQIYLGFWFLHYSDPFVPMDHKQSVYVSTGSRNPNDGDYVKVDDIDYNPGSSQWLYNLFDLSAFHGHSNVYIAIDYTSGNPMISFDVVTINGSKTGVDNAAIDSPTSFTMDSYQSTPAVTGTISIAGSTGTSGPATQVTAQFGYGFQNSNPFDNQDWVWVDAVYSHSDDTRDFFVSSPAFLTVAGELDYAFRFKNGESTWIYADTDGSSNGYLKANSGKMTVNMFPPKGELVKEQTLPEDIINAYSSVDNLFYDYSVADDFEFTVDTEVNSIRWKGIYWSSGRSGNETGIVLKVYANNSSGGDHPGSILYSELVPGYSCEKFMKTDNNFGINIYKYHIDLATPFSASKNTKYWFSVQMKVAESNEFWGQLTTSDSISGQNAAQFDGSSWGLVNDDIGFELYGDITNYGVLVGSVKRSYDGLPLLNANVKITDGGDNWSTSTGSNGEYNILLPLGTYSATAEIDNYQSQTVPGISFSSHGQVVTQNFSLESAKLYYSPSAISNSMNFGSVVTNNLTITNDGPVALSYNLIITTGNSPAMNLNEERNSSNNKIVPIEFNYDLENIFKNIGASPLPPSDKIIDSFNSTADSKNNKSAENFDCYAVNLNVAPARFVKFNSGSPGTFTKDIQLSIDYLELICAGDFVLGDFSSLYGIKFYARELIKVSTADASITSLGILYPSVNGSEVWTGMTAAPNGDIYGSTSDGSFSRLYKIDIATCSATLIGTISSQPLVIDIAINTKGELFGIDIINDNLIKINPATATPTVVGSIGFNANYAQGMDFNDLDGILYYAAYSTNYGGELRTVNTDTGATIPLGSFSSSHELDSLAIPKYVSASWVSLSSDSGTIPPDSTTQLDVIFDAGVVSNFGTYNSEILFFGNHINAVPNLPLTMDIIPSPIISAPMTQDFGSVDLFITSSVPLVVGNVGVGVLSGAVQDIVSPFFISGETNYFIPASSNITLNTHFVSDVEGDFSQNVQLTGGGGKTVVFIGNAIPEPVGIWIIGLLVTRSILKMRRSG